MERVKIVFIEDALVCGGAEQALYDLALLLDPEKFDVTVLAQKPGKDWDQKFRDAGIHLIYDYSCRPATVNPIKKLGNISKKLRTQACYRAGGEDLMSVICPGADILVSYSMWDYPRCGFARGAKSVKYIHGNVQTNPAFRELILRDRELLPRYDRIVCVSQASKQAFTEVTGRTEGVEAHYNPINSGSVRHLAAQSVTLPTDAPLVCGVGRLSYEKGFERLIVQHKRLVEEGLRHYLVLVGDGPDRDYIRRTVQAMDAQDTVILAGYQANPYPYIAASRFLVCPSFTEGLPVVGMEAICLGVPVVAAVPTIAELFGDEQCGLITPNTNESLRDGMRQMLTDEELYRRCRAGAEKRSSFFTGHRMAKEVEEMFLQLMRE